MDMHKLATILSYVYIFLFINCFARKRNKNKKQLIVVRNKAFSYVCLSVNGIISIISFYTSHQITIMGNIIADKMYRIPFYGFAMLNGIIVSISFIAGAKETIQNLEAIQVLDQKLANKFSIHTDYKYFAIFLCIVIFLGITCMFSFTVLNSSKGSFIYILMHVCTLSLGLAQTVTPLLIIIFSALYGARKCKSIVNKINEISSKKCRKYIIIEKLNDLMDINFSIVQTVIFSNQISRLNLATALFVVFYVIYFIVISFKTVGVTMLKELIAVIVIITIYYVGVIYVFSKFVHQQKQMSRALIDFSNSKRDKDIDRVIIIYLQMMFHHKIDVTAYGMFSVNPGLLFKMLGTLSTAIMFTFTILPELLMHSG